MKQILFLLVAALLGVASAVDCTDFNSQLEDLGTTYSHARGYVNEQCGFVVDTYNDLFTEGTELGSGTALYYKGCKIFDLWGGNRTNAGAPWLQDTMVNTFSAGKGLHAFALAKEQDLSGFEYSDRVTQWWPGFGQNGKESVTLEILNSYRAGVLAMNELYFSNQTFDNDFMDTLAAATFPAWNPDGSLAGYHPVSIGHFVDALVRRMDPDGRNIEEVVTDTFVGSGLLSEVELYYTPDLSLDSRIAHLTNETFRAIANGFITALCGNPATALFCRALVNPVDLNNDIFNTNTASKRITYTPSGFVWLTPRTLAIFYGLLSFPGTRNSLGLLSNQAFREAIEEVYRSFDIATGSIGSYTKAGFEYPTPGDPFSSSATAYGRTGLCGQVGFGDPDKKMGFSYLTRNCYWDANPNVAAMMSAAYECIAAVQAAE